MYSAMTSEVARVQLRDRQVEAAAAGRAARLVAARRWQRRAEVATYRARLARLAVQ
jgi:hypothetical protein